MKIFFMGNNWVGWQTLKWLKSQKADIVGIALPPPEIQKYGAAIYAEANLPPGRVFSGAAINSPETIQSIKEIKPDIALSVYFVFLFKAGFRDIFPEGVINLHPGYLPYNRGADSHIWSLIEHTPAGATLHYVDEGIDTGDIIAREEVSVEPVDTGETLYAKTETAAVKLFCSTWPLILNRENPRIPQDKKNGTYHNSYDLKKLILSNQHRIF